VASFDCPADAGLAVLHKKKIPEQGMRSGWVQHIRRVMEWSNVSRACLPFVFLLILYSLYLVWAAAMLRIDGGLDVLNMEAYHSFVTVIVATMGGAALLLGAGLLLRRRDPDAVWFQYVSANYYGLSLVLGGYVTGSLNMATGAVLMGAPIVGFLLLERRAVIIAISIAFLAVLALNVAAAWGYLPYAPLLKSPVDQRSALLWTASQFAFVAPFMLSTISQTLIMVSFWRVREANARRLSLTDTLTGVHNRRSILELLERDIADAQRRAEGLCVVLLDLDHFKQINDRYGHPVGDRVLMETAVALSACIRPEDALGRFGGEEFLLLLPGTTPAQAAQVVARCQEQLRALDVRVDGDAVPVRASFGLAWMEAGQAAAANCLVHEADRALYAAKSAGRDRLVQAAQPCTGTAGAPVHYAQRPFWRSVYSVDSGWRVLGGVLEWTPVARAVLVLGILLFMGLNYGAYLFYLLQRDDAATLINTEVAGTMLRLVPGILLGAGLLMAIGLRLRLTQPKALWFQYLAMGFFGLVLVGVGYTLGILYMPTGVMLLCTVLIGCILFDRRLVLTTFFGALATVIALAFASALGWLPYAPMISVHGTAWQTTSPFWLLSIYFFASWAMIIALGLTDRVLGRWRAREAEVQRLSQVDALTQVGNRRRILELLEKDLQRAGRDGTPLAVVLLDLDHFKRINDTWGHPTGDRVLQAAARILTTTLRQSDAVGRYGGEEFMLLLRETSPEGAWALVERCRAQLAATVVTADCGSNFFISASFGFIYVQGDNPHSMDELIRATDSALYKAKAAGRNRVVAAEPKLAFA
jgi:diguanylate cyclase (GGDEF)-like protein